MDGHHAGAGQPEPADRTPPTGRLATHTRLTWTYGRCAPVQSALCPRWRRTRRAGTTLQAMLASAWDAVGAVGSAVAAAGVALGAWVAYVKFLSERSLVARSDAGIRAKMMSEGPAFRRHVLLLLRGSKFPHLRQGTRGLLPAARRRVRADERADHQPAGGVGGTPNSRRSVCG